MEQMRGWAIVAAVAMGGCGGASGGLDSVPQPEDAQTPVTVVDAGHPDAAPACRLLTCADYRSACGGLSDGCGGHVECPCSGQVDAATPPPNPPPAVDAAPPPQAMPDAASAPEAAMPPPASDLGKACGTMQTSTYTCNANEWCGGTSVYTLTCRTCLPRFGACGNLIEASGYDGPGGVMCCSGSCSAGACD